MGAFDYGLEQTSGIKPNGLINGASSLVYDVHSGNLIGSIKTIKQVLTGAQTAGALATVLSLSGKGVISFLAVSSTDATSRTHRCKVTVDGVVVFDGTSVPVATANAHQIIGNFGYDTTNVANFRVTFEPLTFDSSLLIEYASSVTETAKTTISYRYMPRA